MGLRDWFYGKDDKEYSSQTNLEQEYSASTSQPEATAEAGGFRSSFSSTVTRCEPDENGQVRCRRHVTTRSRNGEGWSEQRTDEEVPYEEVGGQMHDPMLAEMERMMSDFAQTFGHFGGFGLFRQPSDPWEEGPRMPHRPPPDGYRRPGFFKPREDEDVFDA